MHSRHLYAPSVVPCLIVWCHYTWSCSHHAQAMYTLSSSDKPGPVGESFKILLEHCIHTSHHLPLPQLHPTATKYLQQHVTSIIQLLLHYKTQIHNIILCMHVQNTCSINCAYHSLGNLLRMCFILWVFSTTFLIPINVYAWILY